MNSNVDYQMLWDTAENDLPGLFAAVEQMLRDIGKHGGN
jgi:uncharacterized protein with HEPN domain